MIQINEDKSSENGKVRFYQVINFSTIAYTNRMGTFIVK